MDAPFQLAAGLHLEKAHVVLPWGSTFEKLSLIGNPEVHRHPKATNISWKNESVLGGLPVHLEAITAAGVNIFYLHATTRAESAQAEYAEILDLLSQRLGPPHSSVIDEGYPWTKWQWGKVGLSLRIAERFTEHVSFMIAKGIPWAR